MEFWNSLLTEKSWQLMQNLKKEEFRFIVIGGWATYLWTKQHKSKDIDVIIPNFEILEMLKQKYDLRKNDRLKKYEIKFEEIDLDIYVPHYSKLALPVENIAKMTAKIEGFEVINAEALLILKQGAELDRQNSVKGQKDRIDIMTLLLYSEIDFKKYKEILSKHGLENYKQRLKEIIISFKEFKYLNTNQHEYAKTKKELLKKI